MRKLATILLVLSAFTVFTSSVRADVAAVNKYLAEATELAGKGSQFFADAGAKLELAEASMDDVPEADKAALKAKIDALKTQIQNTAGAEDKARIDRDVKALLTDVEGVIGNAVAWPGKSDELTALLSDPKTTAALGAAAVADYKKQFATFAKVHAGKMLKENLATATTQVDELEKDWADRKADVGATGINPNARDRSQDDLEQIGRFFKDLPADNADVKALQARVGKVRAEKSAADGNAAVDEQVKRIDAYLESNKEEFSGMDAETAAPAWTDYKAGQEPARSLGAPKTLEFIRRVSDWLPTFQQGEAFVAVKDQPPVKAKLDDVKAKLAAARAKIRKNGEALVAGLEAEKVSANNTGDAGLLRDQIRNALGEATDDGKPLIARIDKAQNDFKNAGDKAEADGMAYYQSMTEQADKAWPAMMAKFDVAEGFDPNNAAASKGKYVKIVGHNQMGWSFKHGDFPYATKVNGVPVAGRYDPAVKAALAEVEAKLGRAIGDNDADGEWTAIAQVDGGTGQLVQLVSSTGDVTVDGTKVGTVEGRQERPVDAPIVTVVALKAGPVAVAQGQGAVKQDGAVAAPTGGAVAAGGRRGVSLIGLLSGVLAVVVGAACLMKSKFAPLAGNASAVHLVDQVGGQNLAYAGLAGVVLGVLDVLLNLLALPHAFVSAAIGILASLVMVVAGLVVSREFLEARGLLPVSISGPIAPFAVPAGLACAALGLLTIVTSLF